jgi:CelD/BcsL family acetyltransferase involved in cellulose biosynthesis
VTVDWTGDPTAFVARDWMEVVDADPDATVFHTPHYLKLYWEEFGSGRLEIAFVRRGGRDVAVAAFEFHDDGVRWLGGFDVTDYMGPTGRPAHQRHAATALMAGLAERDGWSRADLAGLPGDGGWLPLLGQAAREAGLEVRVAEDGVAPFLDLPATYEQYLDRLPGKLRHEIRRKDRRLREAFPDLRLGDTTAETLGQDLDRFVELHRSSPGEKGRFMVPGMELFFRRLGEELLSDGTFRYAFLEAGGKQLAGAVGFRFRDRLLLYNSAYDHARARLAPGMALVAEVVRSAIEEGRRGVDLLKGDLAYKYRFGARPRQVCRLLITRR